MGEMKNRKYSIKEVPEEIRHIFKNPYTKISSRDIEILEKYILEVSDLFGSFVLDFEYQRERGNDIIHQEPGKPPHVVLKGRNYFDEEIKVRRGDGKIETVYPGEKFKTHILVQEDYDLYLK